jgi:ArsR family transcriptional regulator, arsenate/arsenite/antimonite-responsive transcriptional repressor
MGRTKKKSFQADINVISDIYKALGHPARLQIMKVLLEKKHSTCGEIVNELPLAQSTISKHLIELKRVGLIAEQFEGKKTIFYLIKDSLVDSNDYLTNYINSCKMSNVFYAPRKRQKTENLHIDMHDAIKSELKSRSRKPNLNLKSHNYTFKKEKP